MTDLHAIFRAVGNGRWQTYSRPESIYVAGESLEAARREFLAAAEFHFDDEWQQVTLFEHVEHEASPGVYIRTSIDDKTAARDRTAEIVRRSLGVPEATAIIRAQALESSTGGVVFVCCESDDRIRWLSGQLGRADAVQVVAPLGGQGIWWMPLAAPAKEVPASESETLAQAGLGGADALVGQLPAVAQKYAERAEWARREVAAALDGGAAFSPALPTLVAA